MLMANLCLACKNPRKTLKRELQLTMLLDPASGYRQTRRRPAALLSRNVQDLVAEFPGPR